MTYPGPHTNIPARAAVNNAIIASDVNAHYADREFDQVGDIFPVSGDTLAALHRYSQARHRKGIIKLSDETVVAGDDEGAKHISRILVLHHTGLDPLDGAL